MKNDECLTRILFRIGDHAWTWHHVLACAEHCGQLEPLMDRLRRAQAAVDQAMAQGGCLPDNALQDAITEWRYAFNLISAKETEDWLQACGLDIGDLGEYINRELWCQALPECTGAAELWLPELGRMLWVQATLSGELPALVRSLVHRALCAELRSSQNGELPAIRGTRFAAAFESELAPLEGAYEACLAESADHDACSRAIAMLRPDLLRIRYQSASFANHDAAAEARLCVRDDGETLTEVADRVGAASHEGVTFASDLDSATATRLLSAALGECTVPNDTHTIYKVLSKIEPSLTDPPVADRARQHCLSRELRPHLNKLEWVCRPMDIT
jgi:hypothetical protein